jgi:GH15 family glucan-1,4-alpha-glucosidase
MTTPIENLAMIGDGETSALVSSQGAIEWLCLPRFDSPACFASLVGTRENGHWTIAPTQGMQESRQRYEPDTMVLETEFITETGTVRLTDFMPVRDGNPMVIRTVTGVKGRVGMRSEASLRFDYGNIAPMIERDGDLVVCKAGADEAWLQGFKGAAIASDGVCCEFELAGGEERTFLLVHASFNRLTDSPRGAPDVSALLEKTRSYWRDWMDRQTHSGAYEAQFKRSLLTLKALVCRSTGGLVAAPTTSLPEKPGGSLNWDYRYCWLRDASFAVDALLGSGYHQEAQAWRDWLLRAVAGAPDKMAIVYRLDGTRRLEESSLPWLSGYRFAQPVRIGNGAAGQFQLDVYGELVNTLHLCEEAGMPRSEQMKTLERAVAAHVEKVWTQPDQGLWESRGEARHYTYSKVMAWVVIDRFLRGSGGAELSDEEAGKFKSLRDHMHSTICAEGFDTGLNTFTTYFGSQEVDASLLLLPKLGFLAAGEPRMAATIAAIEEHLQKDGLVYRNHSTSEVSEGAFLACTFWLSECQLAQGRVDDARASIERVLGLAGPSDLLSEEYDLAGKKLAGNFPQALSHTALVNAVLALRKHEAKQARD